MIIPLIDYRNKKLKLRYAVAMFYTLLFPFAMLPCIAHAQGSSMNKHDLSAAGFSIVAPTDPAYDIELRKLGFGDNSDALAVKPFAVILKNSSLRSVVAFGVKWTISDALKNIVSRSFNYVQPGALLDGGRNRHGAEMIEHQIRPGSSRLITVNGMARNAEELHELTATSFIGSVIAVDLDLAIFDDGEAVGPNETGLMERFAAHVNAEQDLMQEVDLRLSKGESLKQILTDVRSRLAPDSGEIPTTPAAMYDHNLRIYLHELETTARNAGEEAAKTIVAHRKYGVRPTIRQPLNSSEKNEK